MLLCFSSGFHEWEESSAAKKVSRFEPGTFRILRTPAQRILLFPPVICKFDPEPGTSHDYSIHMSPDV